MGTGAQPGSLPPPPLDDEDVPVTPTETDVPLAAPLAPELAVDDAAVEADSEHADRPSNRPKSRQARAIAHGPLGPASVAGGTTADQRFSSAE